MKQPPKRRGKFGLLYLSLCLAPVVMAGWLGWISLTSGGPDKAGSILYAMTGRETPSAPDFELPDLNGARVRLDQFRGKTPVLLYFWATWCPSCHEVKPQLIDLRNKVSEKDLAILGINVGTGDSLERVKRFQQGHPVPFPILYDANGEISRKYGVQGIPLFILVDRDGKVVYWDHLPPLDYKQYLQ